MMYYLKIWEDKKQLQIPNPEYSATTNIYFETF